MRPILCPITMIMACCLALAPAAHADEATDRTTAEQAIRAAAKRYTEALKQGNAEAMLELWVSDGDVVDEFGNSTPAKDVVSRESAIRAAASEPDSSATIEIVDNDLRFITPEVAIEDGKVEVTPNGSGSSTVRGRFTAIWVKQDDAWKLASLREVRVPTQPTNELAALDWMVGDWRGEAGNATFKLSTHWNDKHTYLMRNLTVSSAGKDVMSGEQRIGVDPLDGQIKSWMHDADGGHGEGIWTRHGDTWVVRATGVSPDGRRTTGTNLYKPDGEDGLVWKSTGATAEGHSLPDFEITLHRVANDKK